MSHQIAVIEGQYAFTRRQGTEAAWHRLGGETPEDAPLEVWAANAKMNYTVESAKVNYQVPGQFMHTMDNRCVLYRSDTKAPLGVVSCGYKVVQPAEVLDFFRSITEVSGWKMETAGVLRDGAKYWAMATNEQIGRLSKTDTIKPYLLLATACDGSLATTAQFTSVRVVCANTLAMSISAEEKNGAIKVPHSAKFDADAVRARLGLGETFEQFMADADKLASTKVDENFAQQFLADLMMDKSNPNANKRNKEIILNLFQGAGMGAKLNTSKGTAWGLLNAVTEFVDHHKKAANDSTLLDTAWFGNMGRLKNKARDQLISIAA